GLAALWATAKRHPKTSQVYFGGAGGEKAMHDLFPQAATFHRYKPKDAILKEAVANGVDLAGIPPKRFSRRLVRKLQANGIRVTTTQLNSKRAVRAANRVGIRLVQTDRSRRTVRRWCS
ncbi:hypothetical protein, partial [Nocardioides sp.]|uniref:hypothetical protein n=1 Tax=Nocardioides sp. TaxID=35761 RepID=UPI002ED5B0F5